MAYALAVSTYGLVSVRYGVDRMLTRDIVHYPDKRWHLVDTSLKLRGLLCVLFFGIILLWKLLGADTMSWGAIVIVFANTLIALDLQPVYDAMQQMPRHATYNLIQKSLYLAIIWAILLLNPQGLSLLFIGLASLGSITTYLLLQHRWVMLHKTQVESPQRVTWRDLWRMAKTYFSLFIGSLIGLSFTSFNQIILKHQAGSSELGGYAASWQVVSIAMLFLTQISRIGYPATARITLPTVDRPQRTRFLFKYSSVMILTAAVVCVPVILFPGTILTHIFKPEYASDAMILRCMGVYTLMFALGLVASQYVIAAHLHKVYLLSVSLGGVLSIVLCLILIPKLSGLGAVLSLLLSHGLSMGLFAFFAIRHLYSIKPVQPTHEAPSGCASGG